MTYYNAVFDQKQYRSVTKKAAKMYLATAVSAAIPLIITDVPDAKEYVHVIFNEATGVTAGLEFTDHGRKMSVRSNYEIFYLPAIQGAIQINNSEIKNFGASLIGDKKEAEIEALVKKVDDWNIHGARNDDDVQIQEGLIGQLTSIPNLSSAGGHDCSTKGEIWHWIKEMIEDIPLAMRQESGDMVMMINEKTIAEAQAPDRIYNDMVEWDFIDRQFISGGVHGRKIGRVIITDKINALADDDTDGNGADTVDTLGTDGRILIFCPNKKYLARVVSRGFSLIGEEQHMLAVDQLYGTRQRVCVFDGDGCNYSERLSF